MQHEEIDIIGQSAGGHQLFHGKREQLHQPYSTGQRLGDAGEQAKLLGTGQHVFSRDRLSIDKSLEIGKEVRHPLGLVEDQPVGKMGEHAARIVFFMEMACSCNTPASIRSQS